MICCLNIFLSTLCCLIWLVESCWVTKFQINTLTCSWNPQNIRHMKNFLLPHLADNVGKLLQNEVLCFPPIFHSANCMNHGMQECWIIVHNDESDPMLGLTWLNLEVLVTDIGFYDCIYSICVPTRNSCYAIIFHIFWDKTILTSTS